MEIKLKKYQNIYIIMLEGELDLYNAPKLENVFNSLVSKNIASFVVDFNDVDYIDSSGVGILLKIHSITKSKNLSFLLSSVSGEVLNVFTLTNLVKFFSISEDYQQGIKRLLKKTVTQNGAVIND